MSELCLLSDKCFVKFQFYYGPFDCHKSLIRKLLQANGGTKYFFSHGLDYTENVTNYRILPLSRYWSLWWTFPFVRSGKINSSSSFFYFYWHICFKYHYAPWTKNATVVYLFTVKAIFRTWKCHFLSQGNPKLNGLQNQHNQASIFLTDTSQNKWAYQTFLCFLAFHPLLFHFYPWNCMCICCV